MTVIALISCLKTGIWFTCYNVQLAAKKWVLSEGHWVSQVVHVLRYSVHRWCYPRGKDLRHGWQRVYYIIKKIIVIFVEPQRIQLAHSTLEVYTLIWWCLFRILRFQSAFNPLKYHLVQLKEAQCFTLIYAVFNKLPETYFRLQAYV